MLKQLIQQAVTIGGLRMVGTALGVGVSIAIARTFGDNLLGVYSYCVALLAIAAVPISNGWSTMLLRSVARKDGLDGHSRLMTRHGLVGAILIAMMAAVIGYGAILIGNSDIAQMLEPVALIVVVALAIALLSDQISALRMATIRGINRPALAQLPESLVRPLAIIIGVGLSWVLARANDVQANIVWLFVSVAVAAMISAVVGQIILSRLNRPGEDEGNTVDSKGWIASAAALAGSAGLVQLNGYADLLILGSYVEASELGHYRVALQLAMLANFGYIALNMLAGQRFSRFIGTGELGHLSSTATYLSRLALLAALPVPLILFGFGETLFSILFGAEFADARLPALIVSIGLLFSSGIGMAYSLLVMKGKEFVVMRTTAAALVVNILLCILLIPRFGIVGAAIANLSATVGWNMLLWLVARRTTGIDTSAVGLSARETISNEQT